MAIRGIHIVLSVTGGAVGKTISENRQVLDIRKSSVTNRSSFRLNRGGLPFHLFSLIPSLEPSAALDTAAVGAQQIFEHVP